jgi:hypothetical protein
LSIKSVLLEDGEIILGVVPRLWPHDINNANHWGNNPEHLDNHTG